nr:hypothetical protein [uncultured Pelagimonas sp.]
MRFLVDLEMGLAPDTPFRTAVPAGIPRAFTFRFPPSSFKGWYQEGGLGTSAIDQQVLRTLATTIADVQHWLTAS